MATATSLNDEHYKLAAHMVDFAGFDMPLHYGSQIKEHMFVRQDAGMFDVSHMGVVDLSGDEVKEFLAYLLANNINKLTKANTAIYSCMLNEQGGVKDDLIAYYFNDNSYRLVINAGTKEKDIAWIENVAKDFSVAIDVRDDLSIIAVQGPNAKNKLGKVLGDNVAEKLLTLKPFNFFTHNDLFISTTGYTGEDGVEIIVPNVDAEKLWQDLYSADIFPCGLAARDTLRLEAGFNLYGNDMDENITPYEAGLAWTLALEPANRNFMGKEALLAKKASIKNDFVGVILLDRGVLRDKCKVITDLGEGIITSGGYGPFIKRSIGMARVPKNCKVSCKVEIRSKQLNAKIVKLPFVKRGVVLNKL